MQEDVLKFVRELVEDAPELEAVYHKHIDDCGELLPHVLMGEITRLVIATAGHGDWPAWLSRFLDRLESGLQSGSDAIGEVIGVSFVENLCGEARAISVLRPKFGFSLRRELKTICGI